MNSNSNCSVTRNSALMKEEGRNRPGCTKREREKEGRKERDKHRDSQHRDPDSCARMHRERARDSLTQRQTCRETDFEPDQIVILSQHFST